MADENAKPKSAGVIILLIISFLLIIGAYLYPFFVYFRHLPTSISGPIGPAGPMGPQGIVLTQGPTGPQGFNGNAEIPFISIASERFTFFDSCGEADEISMFVFQLPSTYPSTAVPLGVSIYHESAYNLSYIDTDYRNYKPLVASSFITSTKSRLEYNKVMTRTIEGIGFDWRILSVAQTVTSQSTGVILYAGFNYLILYVENYEYFYFNNDQEEPYAVLLTPLNPEQLQPNMFALLSYI